MNHIIVAKPALTHPLHVVNLTSASRCHLWSLLLNVISDFVLHHVKVMSCHYYKRNHIFDRLCDLHLVLAPLCPWIFLIVNISFTSDFHPHVVANLSNEKSCYHLCYKWRFFFSFDKHSLHYRYCRKPRVVVPMCFYDYQECQTSKASIATTLSHIDSNEEL